MSKIKMRTKKCTIKLRDNRKTAQQAFRRRNIKTLKKSVEPIQPEQERQETQEAQAMDEITKVTVPALRRVGVFPRSVQQRATQRKQKAAQQKPEQSQEPELWQAYDETPAPEGQAPVQAAQTTQAPGTTPVPGAAPQKQQGGPRMRTAREVAMENCCPENVTRGHTPETKKTPTPKEPRRALRQKSATMSRAQPRGAQSAKTAQATKTAQTAQAKRAAQTVHAVQTVKKAEKTERVAKALKAAVQAAGKAVCNVLAAVGGAAGLLAPLLAVLLIGGLLASPLGLFFSTEAEGEMALTQAMSQLNTEFSDRIAEIENSVTHDEVQQSGQRAVWKEILTVYAVKTTTDAENPLDAVTMDEEHFIVLEEIFWDMNTIEYSTETYTEEVTVEAPAEDSNDEDDATEETQPVEKMRLLITINSKTAQQMAEEYGFNKEQLGYVTELLSEEYAELWAVLTVPGGGSDDIVAVALSQVGNTGGQPYWSWYGFSSRVSWCACFVSWCSDQCGYIDAGILPKFSYCDTGVDWFKARGQWQGRDYVPAPGDIIFFDPDGNGSANHVGIVESCDGSYVYTVEGNANDAVKWLSYTVGNYRILGYGVPAYS